MGIKFELVDIISSDWISNIRKSNCDGYLVRPSYKRSMEKNVWRKVIFLNKVMRIPIYPSYDEILIYENKKYVLLVVLINYLILKHGCFTQKRTEFIKMYKQFPIVFKTNIGSAAMG